jgi:RND family efflux transporter MFP subunit
MTGNTPTSDLIAIGITSQEHLQQVASFLDHLALAINNVSSSISTSNGITISEARTNIAAARTSITSAINSLATATDTYNNAKRELALKQAGATPQSIQAQEAKLAQAEAEVAVLQAQLDKTVLRAPFAGLVTRQDAKLGQGVSSGTSLVTLMANGALKITAKVPEVDIGKVSVGNKVMIRLDAFPGVDFAGTVSKIDPGETVLDGVVNYQITINFDEQDARLRSGLTANLDIITQNKEVLAVPESALVEKNNGVYVRKVVKGTILESAVTTGINGQDSLVEIVSGLEEGDQIMISAQ